MQLHLSPISVIHNQTKKNKNTLLFSITLFHPLFILLQFFPHIIPISFPIHFIHIIPFSHTNFTYSENPSIWGFFKTVLRSYKLGFFWVVFGNWGFVRSLCVVIIGFERRFSHLFDNTFILLHLINCLNI